MYDVRLHERSHIIRPQQYHAALEHPPPTGSGTGAATIPGLRMPAMAIQHTAAPCGLAWNHPQPPERAPHATQGRRVEDTQPCTNTNTRRTCRRWHSEAGAGEWVSQGVSEAPATAASPDSEPSANHHPHSPKPLQAHTYTPRHRHACRAADPHGPTPGQLRPPAGATRRRGCTRLIPVLPLFPLIPVRLLLSTRGILTTPPPQVTCVCNAGLAISTSLHRRTHPGLCAPDQAARCTRQQARPHAKM